MINITQHVLFPNRYPYNSNSRLWIHAFPNIGLQPCIPYSLSGLTYALRGNMVGISGSVDIFYGHSYTPQIKSLWQLQNRVPFLDTVLLPYNS